MYYYISRNTIKIRFCSAEFTCNRARKNNLLLPAMGPGTAVLHNCGTVYRAQS